MKLFNIKRTSKYENRYSKNMGRIKVLVVKIKKRFSLLPYKTIHKYRKTYYGKVKDVDKCDLNR